MPLLTTKGAGSASSLGITSASGPANYIEDMFSCFLYAGTSSALTITNGIDLSTKGGLVWTKVRTTTYPHCLTDTIRGGNKQLFSNTTDPSITSSPAEISSFNTTGYTLAGSTVENYSGQNFVGWTFRKQPKFFDVVTYTGSGAGTQTIAHNLGSVPGCIIVKLVSGGYTSGVGGWGVYHRSTGASQVLELNTTVAAASDNWFNTTPTSSNFYVFGNDPHSNLSGGTYVAYLFAHDAGGFGLSGTDNVISCGSYTRVDANGTDVNLGFEPQWVMLKPTNAVGDWYIADTMRDNSNTNRALLLANSSSAEIGNDGVPSVIPTATGFKAINIYSNGNTVAYIAIRRGPMKVPTLGTSVFSPTLVTGNGTNDIQITGVGFPPDLLIGKTMGTVLQPLWYDKLRGKGKWLESNNALAEQTLSGGSEGLMLQDGFVVDNNYGSLNINTRTYVDWLFRRAPSFFDEVCYTGTGSAITQAHNLAAVPELLIVKRRNANNNWAVYSAALGNGNRVFLNQTQASAADSSLWNNTTPTSSVFTVGTAFATNNLGDTYVAYLFASCPGVSKVGSYTGTGALQTINCGFTGGARFVLIKRTDSTGDWWTYDSARGITAGNDPYLYLNSQAAEVTGTNYVDTDSTGFKVTAAAPAELNANGGTYIFLAIA